MNQKLQNILDIIQQSEKLDTKQKENLLIALKDADKELEITAFKLERTEKVKKTTAILLEETIEELEQKRKSVEEQNRELEIEASLERVRAVAMSMHKSDNLISICEVSFKEFQKLGFDHLRNAIIHIPNDEKKFFMDYDFSDFTGGVITKIEYGSHPIVNEYLKKIRSAEDAYFEVVIPEDQLKGWKDFRKKSGQKDDPRLDNANALYYYLFSIGIGDIGISAFKPINESQIKILKRFRNVFDLAYRRYNDIALAEQQARESQIEAALERVRSRSLAMHKSEELNDVVMTLFGQMNDLEIDIDGININLLNDDLTGFDSWFTAPGYTKAVCLYTPYFDTPVMNDIFNAVKSKQDFLSKIYPKEEKDAYFSYLYEHSDYKNLPDERKKMILDAESWHLSVGIANNTGISIHSYTGKTFSEKEHDILKRFAKVFNQSYRRFLDLQKAEAQAREAEIELALERVRARTMAMQKSDELKEVIQLVYEQFVHLKINVDHAGFVVDYSPKGDWHFWIADKQEIPSKITHPYFDSVWAHQFNEAKEKGIDFFATNLNFDEKNKFYNELLSYVPGLPDKSKDFYLSCPGLAATTALFDNVSLYIENFSGAPYTDEENKILMRFGKVFQQTYTRFLDLQKAELQAREAQIEAALERVRSRSLAMHHSSELSAVVDTLLREFTNLEFTLNFCIINLIDEEDRSNTVWAANPETGKLPESYYMKFEDYPFHHAMWDAWKAQKKNFIYTIEGEEKKIYDEYLYTNTEFRRFPKHVQEANKALKRYVAGFTFFKYSGLQTVSENHISGDELNILERFGRVFEQSYTRFLDLQKAEKQAREAEIQLALERVRARTMAMHRSEELSETSFVLFQQFVELGIVPNRFFIGTMNEEETMFDVWITEWGGEMSSQNFKVNIEEPLQWKKVFKAWKAHDKSLVVDINGEDLTKWNEYLESIGLSVKNRKSVTRVVNSFAIFSKGFIAITTHQITSTETIGLLERFAIVFDLTYRRFLDLKKAEAQARESHIEAALERVRAKTMAMHKSDELADTAAVVFQQLINLGIEPNRIYIAIIKDEKGDVVFWITNEDGSKVSPGFEANLNDNSSFKKMLNGWNEKKKSITIDMQGEELQKYFGHLTNLGVPFKGGLSQKRRLQYIAYFSKGFIGVASPDETKPETLQLLERFAAVFNLTYTRFNDLLRAEAQNRIIQAENERKTKELEEARQLQLSLLPRELPKLPNLDIAVYMKTATEVGGDYYDFNVQGDGTLDIGFGDATGHGLQAGTMITLMKGFFTSDVSRFTPEKFLEHCNRMIRNIKLGRILMSFSHLRFERKRLLISSAGMPPVYYNHKESNRTEEIMIQGLPLGALQNTSYNLVVKELKRGDTILLLTDGLPEQMNNRKVIFDYSRVLNYFDKIAENTPNEIITNLVKETEEWMCGQQQDDDITFVVIRAN